MFRFAICNEVYRDWPFDRAMAHARTAGYQGVEVAPQTLRTSGIEFERSRLTELREAVAKQGLAVVGLHWLLAGTRGIHWTAAEPGVQRKTIEYFRRLIEICAELQGGILVLGSPQQRNLAAGMTFARGSEIAAHVVEQILPQLESAQVTLAVEPLGPTETNFLNTADEVSQFIRRFESPRVRLHLDVKAMSSEPHPIPEIIAAHRAELVHFHANDPNKRGPGMGQVDFVPILRALVQIGYRNWVSVETFDESAGIDALVVESIRNLQRDMALVASY